MLRRSPIPSPFSRNRKSSRVVDGRSLRAAASRTKLIAVRFGFGVAYASRNRRTVRFALAKSPWRAQPPRTALKICELHERSD
eukprot:scaffold347_cov239-Pinguiococcus_pyrenoidosus.AAC.40